MKIKYEPHPVSPERKAELRADGYKIIDARFNPSKDDKAVDDDETDDLKAKYQEVMGKKPFHGWDAATLQAKMDEAAE